MNTDTTPSGTNDTLVIRGTGPTMHVTSRTEAKVIVVTKTRAQSLTLGRGTTDIIFAA